MQILVLVYFALVFNLQYKVWCEKIYNYASFY